MGLLWILCLLAENTIKVAYKHQFWPRSSFIFHVRLDIIQAALFTSAGFKLLFWTTMVMKALTVQFIKQPPPEFISPWLCIYKQLRQTKQYLATSKLPKQQLNEQQMNQSVIVHGIVSSCPFPSSSYDD